MWACMMLLIKSLKDLTELQKERQIQTLVSGRYTKTMSSFEDSGSLKNMQMGLVLSSRASRTMSDEENAFYNQLTMMNSNRDQFDYFQFSAHATGNTGGTAGTGSSK